MKTIIALVLTILGSQASALSVQTQDGVSASSAAATYVNKAGDTMTGALKLTGASTFVSGTSSITTSGGLFGASAAIGVVGNAATKLHLSSGVFLANGTAAGITITNAAGVGDIFRAGTGGYLNGVYARYIGIGAEIGMYDSTANAEAAGVTGRGGYWAYGGMSVYNGGEFAWSSTADGAGSQDTNLSRISAGVIGVGTGAAASAAGSLNLAGLTLDKGTGVGQATLDGSTGGCIMLRDTDDAGWTECDALDGTLSCSVDADGVCD